MLVCRGFTAAVCRPSPPPPRVPSHHPSAPPEGGNGMSEVANSSIMENIESTDVTRQYLFSERCVNNIVIWWYRDSVEDKIL